MNDLDVDLPSPARRLKDPKPKVNYVTVESCGQMFLNKDPVDLASLHEKVVALRVDDPDLSIVIRGSAKAKYRGIVNVMDMLQQANVGKVNLATEPFADGAAEVDYQRVIGVLDALQQAEITKVGLATETAP